MKHNTPHPYSSVGDHDSFSVFDTEYERENMPELIRAGWPINWNYVNKDNIVFVLRSAVYRSINQGREKLSDSAENMLQYIKEKVNGTVSFEKRDKVELEDNVGIIGNG